MYIYTVVDLNNGEEYLCESYQNVVHGILGIGHNAQVLEAKYNGMADISEMTAKEVDSLNWISVSIFKA